MARAALVLVSEKYLQKHGIDKAKLPRLLGYGLATDYLALEKKDAPTFSTARKAAGKAFSMANLKPRDMNGVEVHDCFSDHGNLRLRNSWPGRKRQRRRAGQERRDRLAAGAQRKGEREV